MSNEFQGPTGPPWNVDVVADVHAGVYPTEQAAELRALINADPAAAAVLAALDSTVDGLSLMPELTMPASYVQRLDAALDAEYSTTGHRAPPANGRNVSVGAGRAGGSAIIREHLGALLQANPAAEPSGAGRSGAGSAGPVLPRQATGDRPVHPARRQPVIPRVLPGGPRSSGQMPPANDTTASPAPANVTPVVSTPRAIPVPVGRAAGTDTENSAHSHPSVDRPTGPRRVGSLQAQRAKRHRWTGGLLAAAAVAAIGAVTVISLNSGTGKNVAGAPQPGSQSIAPVTVTSAALTSAKIPPLGAATGAINSNDAPRALVLEPGKFGDSVGQIEGKSSPNGQLSDPATYAACLGNNKVNFSDVTGVTAVTYRGQAAYAIVVKKAANTVQILVVGQKCGIGGAADPLASQVVTR